MALGIAKAHKEPTVLVWTSGSAVGPLFAAVLEAQYSGVPLIVLSADRPHSIIACRAPKYCRSAQNFWLTAVNTPLL